MRHGEGAGERRRGTTIAIVALALFAAFADAHDTWLLPDQFLAPRGAGITLRLTSGMAFPKPETAVAADRLVAARLRVAGRTQELKALQSARGSLQIRVIPRGEGVAVAWVATRPRTLELAADEVRHYLDEIGARDTAGREWESAGAGRWRESYVKLAKTVFRVGGGDDGSWGEPVGLALELVPEADPTTLMAGSRLAVRLLFDGQPLPGVEVSAVGPGGSPQRRRADPGGRAEFDLAAAGPWLVRATRLVRARAPDLDWESQFATLTFRVAQSPPVIGTRSREIGRDEPIRTSSTGRSSPRRAAPVAPR